MMHAVPSFISATRPPNAQVPDRVDDGVLPAAFRGRWSSDRTETSSARPTSD